MSPISEPHQPHLMLEAGSLSSAEYEAQVRARRDFQRLQRQDSDGDRQVGLGGSGLGSVAPVLVVVVFCEVQAPAGVGQGLFSQQDLSWQSPWPSPEGRWVLSGWGGGGAWVHPLPPGGTGRTQVWCK